MSLKTNFKFHLHKPHSDKPTHIYLIYNYYNKKLSYSIGEKILPKYWYSDKVDQRPKTFNELNMELPTETAKKIAVVNRQIHNKLINIEQALRREIQQYVSAHLIPEPLQLQEFLNKLLNKKIKPVKAKVEYLTEHYQEFIDEMKNGNRLNTKGLRNGHRMSETYIKSHGTTLHNLKKYETKYFKRKKMTFEDINLNWYYHFIKILKEENKAKNTIGCQIKNIKNFMKYTYNKEIHKNDIFLKTEFKIMKEDTELIYLTDEDIDKLYNVDLSKQPTLDKVRDIYLIACYTGLRYSDFINPDYEIQPYGDAYILIIKTKKTGIELAIPLHQRAVQIFKKHDLQMPVILSNPVMNRYLKEIGKLAKINDKVKQSRTYKDKTVVSEEPKYKFMVFHTARRTVSTNLFLSGEFEEAEIRTITGHKDPRVFNRYNRASVIQKAQRLIDKKSFFKN
ncbi:MAG: integrase [Bacteroidota bacterium]|nr:integrase [Bacteroidota bacterium]